MSTDTLAVIGALAGTIGALTGVVSAVWQIRVHQRFGRLISIKLSNLIPVYGPPYAPEFHDDDQVAINVFNRGGASVTVLNYGVSMGRPKKGINLFVLDPHVISTQLPAVLEPGGRPVQVTVPVGQLREAHAKRNLPFRQMRPWVELGDGRRIYARSGVPLA
ncbi:hypothetical protein [Glycomyces xiaoerkulensis]|uniref:hypothetical protein n=1 Tax=Glycomyces xiaoerkulensis TaxID=2038139 RepID=UPI0012FFFC85|nr:hypothetical protein [Glycomyces xiaoerkulensis]